MCLVQWANLYLLGIFQVQIRTIVKDVLDIQCSSLKICFWFTTSSGSIALAACSQNIPDCIRVPVPRIDRERFKDARFARVVLAHNEIHPAKRGYLKLSKGTEVPDAERVKS
jgi:hypothetical protein